MKYTFEFALLLNIRYLLLVFDNFKNYIFDFSLWSKLLKIVPKKKILDKDYLLFSQVVCWIFAMKLQKLWRLWPNSNVLNPSSKTFSIPKPMMLYSTVVFFSSMLWLSVRQVWSTCQDVLSFQRQFGMFWKTQQVQRCAEINKSTWEHKLFLVNFKKCMGKNNINANV